MNTTNWEKTYTEKRDLRGREVGCPVWVPRQITQAIKQECLGLVYQSGKQRRCINDIIAAIGQAQHTVTLISIGLG